MSGNPRRTGKVEAVKALADHLGISPPSSTGGTIPKAWLREVICAAFGPEAAAQNGTKAELIRRAVELAGGSWDDRYLADSGSTVTGEALWQLIRLLSGSPTDQPDHPHEEVAMPDDPAVPQPELSEESEDLAAEDLATAYAQIADSLSALAQAEEAPLGFAPSRDQFEPGDVSFDSHGWLLRVLQVQGWLHLDEDIPLEFVESDPERAARVLFGLLGAAAEPCLRVEDDIVRPSLAGASVLQLRLDSAAFLKDQFAELREALSRRAATDQWLELWEEERQEDSAAEPIRANTRIWPITEFADKATTGRLNLSPTYQRGDVWPTKHSQLLIVSVLRGIPLPSVVLLKPQGDGANTVYEVVDGKQRLTAILRFMGKHPKALSVVDDAQSLQPTVPYVQAFENDYKKFRRLWKTHRSEVLTAAKEAEYYFPFRLPATGSLPREDVRGKYYYEIRDVPIEVGSEEETVRRVFEEQSEYRIPLIEYRDTAPRQIHEVFHLYNRQGKHLNAEEIRNALFHHVALMKLLLVASGDNQDVGELASFIPMEDRWRLQDTGKILSDYRFGTARYRRTKLLSWLTALLLCPSLQENGELAVRSTAKQVDQLLQEIAADRLSHPLADFGRLRALSHDLHACLEAHSSFTGWALRFKDDKDGSKWQELQLVASLVAVFLAGIVHDDVLDLLEDKYDEVASFTATHLRPDKTQNKTQWGFIGKVALGLVELLGVDYEELEGGLLERYQVSCLSTLQAAALHYHPRAKRPDTHST